MPGTQAVRAILTIATDGAVNQPRMHIFELSIAQTQAFHYAGTKAFQYYVSLAHQAQENLTPCGRFKVQRHTTLVAISRKKVQAHARGSMWRHKTAIVTATWLFYFDNV